MLRNNSGRPSRNSMVPQESPNRAFVDVPERLSSPRKQACAEISPAGTPQRAPRTALPPKNRKKTFPHVMSSDRTVKVDEKLQRHDLAGAIDAASTCAPWLKTTVTILDSLPLPSSRRYSALAASIVSCCGVTTMNCVLSENLRRIRVKRSILASSRGASPHPGYRTGSGLTR